MPKKQTAITLPPLLTESDSNAFVGKAKAALAKKLTPTRMEPLLGLVRLAWFSMALERKNEARQLCDWARANVSFTGNYNVWTPAAHCIILGARLCRQDGDSDAQRGLIARIVEHPALAEMDRSSFSDWISQAEKDLETGLSEKSKKWSCDAFARACQRSAYFIETAGAGFYYDEWVDKPALEATLSRALEGLKSRVG